MGTFLNNFFWVLLSRSAILPEPFGFSSTRQCWQLLALVLLLDIYYGTERPKLCGVIVWVVIFN